MDTTGLTRAVIAEARARCYISLEVDSEERDSASDAESELRLLKRSGVKLLGGVRRQRCGGGYRVVKKSKTN